MMQRGTRILGTAVKCGTLSCLDTPPTCHAHTTYHAHAQSYPRPTLSATPTPTPPLLQHKHTQSCPYVPGPYLHPHLPTPTSVHSQCPSPRSYPAHTHLYTTTKGTYVAYISTPLFKQELQVSFAGTGEEHYRSIKVYVHTRKTRTHMYSHHGDSYTRTHALSLSPVIWQDLVVGARR